RLSSPLRRLDARRFTRLLGVLRRPGRIALTLLLVPPRQFQQTLQRVFALVDTVVAVTDLSEARGHRRDREGRRLGIGDFAPVEGRGDASVRCGPDRIR